MSIHYNNIERAEMTAGEQHFINEMQKLPEDCEVYIQPFLNGIRPDVVVVRKGYGIAVIEIKDYNFSCYDYSKNKSQNMYDFGTLNVKSSDKTARNPFSQVMKYRDLLNGLLGNSFIENGIFEYRDQINTSCPFVYFHKHTDREIQQMFASCNHKNLKFIRKIGCDCELSSTILSFLSSENKFFTDSVYSEVCRILSPSLDCTVTFADIILDKKQQELAKSVPGSHKIKGVAGSGKSIVLAHRAVNAFFRTGKPILILTFNITAGNYLRELIASVYFRRTGTYPSKVCFYIINYHALINAWYAEDYAELTFDTVLIDEAQDFQYSWLCNIKSKYLTQDGEYVLFGDEKQNLYNIELDGKDMKTNVSGKWSRLTHNYRLDSAIAELSDAFAKEFLADKYNVENDRQQMYFECYNDSDISYFPMFDADYVDVEKIISDYIAGHGINYGDVCVLSNHGMLSKLEGILRSEKHLACQTVSETREDIYRLYKGQYDKKYFNSIEKIRNIKKHDFVPKTGKLKLCTIHSFKGWEADTVFVIINNRNINYEAVYTAITRGRRNLVIIDRSANLRFYDFFKRRLGCVSPLKYIITK